MAASRPTGRLLVGAGAGIVMLMAGQLVDLRWHARHGRGLGRAADQLWAHAALLLVSGGVLGARRVPARWFVGFRLLLVAAVCHVLIDGWHFWEHYNLRDPVVAHVLLAILKVAMVAGVITTIPTTTTSISIWSGNGNQRLRERARCRR